MRTARMAGVLMLVGAVAFSVQAQNRPGPYRVSSLRGGQPVALLAGHGYDGFRGAPPAKFMPGLAKSATITVEYLAAGQQNAFGDVCIGWPDNARAAFEYSKQIWENLLTSTVTIRISACYANMSSGLLGHSGAASYHRNFANAPIADTWYQATLANALAGQDLNDTDGTDDDGDGADRDVEIIIAYNANGVPWYFGTDGAAPSGYYDFVSVVLHEVCHGLGFAGTMSVSSGAGSWGWGSGYPGVYDRFTQNGSGQALLNTSLFPNGSAALAAQLTGGNIYFSGSNVNTANGGPAKLYAPSTWAGGSSYAHFDEIFNGTANSLMTFSLSDGESQHSPGPVCEALLKDVGWTLGGSGPTPGPNPRAYDAYVWANYGQYYITYAVYYYGASDPYNYLNAAYTYAAYANYFAYYAFVYNQAYGNDYGCAAQAYQYAYYGYLYAWAAYANVTGDAYSYYGAVSEYYACVYSYMVATGQQ